MTYIYNPIDRRMDTFDDGETLHQPLEEYVQDLCEFAGVGVGKNDIITSTGPFLATLQRLNKMIVADVAEKMHRSLTEQPTGSNQELYRIFFAHSEEARTHLADLEISCKLGMFTELARKIEERYGHAGPV